jgi:WD40 repeat protein
MLVTAPSLRYWDTDTGELRHSLEYPGGDVMVNLCWAGSMAAETRRDQSVTVWDLKRRAVVLRVPGYQPSLKNYAVRTALLSRDGRRLVTSGGGPVSIWDVSKAARIGQIDWPEEEAILALHLSPNGLRLIVELASRVETGTEDVFQLLQQQRVRRTLVWDIGSMPPRELGRLHGELAEAQVFSSDSKWIHSSSSGTKGWYDATTLEPRTDLDLTDVSFAPDFQTMARLVSYQPGFVDRLLGRGVAQDKALEIADAATGSKLAHLPQCNLFRYFPDSKRTAVWQENGTLSIWQIPPRRPWYIEFGLPILFVLLLMLAIRHCLRFRKKLVRAANDAPSKSIDTDVALD